MRRRGWQECLYGHQAGQQVVLTEIVVMHALALETRESDDKRTVWREVNVKTG
jgi:hypothetical protein